MQTVRLDIDMGAMYAALRRQASAHTSRSCLPRQVPKHRHAVLRQKHPASQLVQVGVLSAQVLQKDAGVERRAGDVHHELVAIAVQRAHLRKRNNHDLALITLRALCHVTLDLTAARPQQRARALWTFAFSQVLRGANSPAAMSSSRVGRSMAAAW